MRSYQFFRKSETGIVLLTSSRPAVTPGPWMKFKIEGIYVQKKKKSFLAQWRN